LKFSYYPETLAEGQRGPAIFKIGLKRLQTKITISIRNSETDEARKIELTRFPIPVRKFMLCFDGKPSGKLQEVSLTQVCERMRKLLLIMAKQKSCTENR